MTLNDVLELHFIAPMGNVPSILHLGILSHNEAERLRATSVANPLVQQRRQDKQLPGGARLHAYANLYFDARNPMMCAIQGKRGQLTVLRVTPDVLQLPRVMISDQNAASNYARFYDSPRGLAFLLRDDVFARDWRDSNQIIYWQKKSARCAEVLVPKLVEPHFITGAFVCSLYAQQVLSTLAPDLLSIIKPDLFTI